MNQNVNNRFLFYFTIALILVAGGWQLARPHILDDASNTSDSVVETDADKSDMTIIITDTDSDDTTDISIEESTIFDDFFGEDTSETTSKDDNPISD